MSWLSGHLNGVILQTFTKLLVERSSCWLDERSTSQLVEPASSCKRGTRQTDVYPGMFAARSTGERGAAPLKSGALFAERTLAVLPLTHAAEVHDGRTSSSVGGPHPRHGGRVDGASLAVRCEPETADVAASLQHVRQRRCTQLERDYSDITEQ